MRDAAAERQAMPRIFHRYPDAEGATVKVELTPPQVRALISAGCEILAGTGDGWPAAEWRALCNAMTELRKAKVQQPDVPAQKEQPK